MTDFIVHCSESISRRLCNNVTKHQITSYCVLPPLIDLILSIFHVGE